MQYSILLVGVLVFVFYQFTQPPIFFNEVGLTKGLESKYGNELRELQNDHSRLFTEKKQVVEQIVIAKEQNDTDAVTLLSEKMNRLNREQVSTERKAEAIIKEVDPDVYQKDSDFIFFTFVMKYLPHGIIGLLVAVIFAAAMSSSASELNALGSTTTIDFYKRMVNPGGDDQHNVFISRMLTVFWGVLALLFALFASQLDNLIQAVNIVGSVFYGPILGIFLVAFLLKKVRGNAVFIAAIISELIIITLYFLGRNGTYDIGYLWFNPIGAFIVLSLAWLIQAVLNLTTAEKE